MGIDILDELKTLSANLMADRIAASGESLPSLEFELRTNENTVASNTANNDKSGWRLLGSKNVWKADWTNYDKRESNRLNQQKQADKARKRKQRTRRNNIRNEHNTNNDRHQNANMLPPDRILLEEAKQRFSKPPCCSAADATNSKRPVHYRNLANLTNDDRNHRGIMFQRGETLNPYPADRDIMQRTRESSRNWTFGPPPRLSVNNNCASCSRQQLGF